MKKHDRITMEVYKAGDLLHENLADELEEMRYKEESRRVEEAKKTGEKVQKMFPIPSKVLNEHRLGVIARNGNTPVGYNGIIFEYDEGVIEVGGLFINPEYRNRGLTKPIKGLLFDEIKKIDDVERIVTFANEDSRHLNESLGLREATLSEIPQEGLRYCSLNCGNYDQEVLKLGKLCCDTILTKEVVDLPQIDYSQYVRS